MVRQVCPLLPHNPHNSPDLLLSAEFVWSEGGLLELSYNLRPAYSDGDLDALALPSLELDHVPMHGDRCDELWKHNCFEAFIGLPGSQRYWELNVYRFGIW